MLHDLTGPDRERVRPLFAALDYHLSMESVIEGTNPGQVWADDASQPRAAVVLSTEGAYLAGQAGHEAFNAALAERFGAWIASGRGMLAVDLDPPAWEEVLPRLLVGRPPIRQARRHYTCTGIALDWRRALPAGYEVRRLDAELLGDAAVSIPDHARGWISGNWGSEDAFLRLGFGFGTLHGHDVVSWCIADCVSGDRCEVGIHTAEAHRRRGLAACTAAAAVEHALQSGFVSVGWHCDEENEGSWRTAERAGFVHDRDYTFRFCFFDEAQHRAEAARRA